MDDEMRQRSPSPGSFDRQQARSPTFEERIMEFSQPLPTSPNNTTSNTTSTYNSSGTISSRSPSHSGKSPNQSNASSLRFPDMNRLKQSHSQQRSTDASWNIPGPYGKRRKSTHPSVMDIWNTYTEESVEE